MAADHIPSSSTKLQPGSPQDPTPFGKYLLMGMIARGGMAEVYRAKARNGSHGLGDRVLAIKCMRPQLAKESRFVEMFIREGKLAVLLDNDFDRRARSRSGASKGATSSRWSTSAARI